MKQINLAVHTGITRTHISRLENGKVEPGLKSLEILAISFEMSLSQLFSGLK
jgi:transcriptional regulator with XRE-family HTH domain